MTLMVKKLLECFLKKGGRRQIKQLLELKIQSISIYKYIQSIVYDNS